MPAQAVCKLGAGPTDTGSCENTVVMGTGSAVAFAGFADLVSYFRNNDTCN